MTTFEKSKNYVLMAVVGLTVGSIALAFGTAEANEFVNDRVEQFTATLAKFNYTQYTWSPDTLELSASGGMIAEDLADVIAEHYGFNVTGFDSTARINATFTEVAN